MRGQELPCGKDDDVRTASLSCGVFFSPPVSLLSRFFPALLEQMKASEIPSALAMKDEAYRWPLIWLICYINRKNSPYVATSEFCRLNRLEVDCAMDFNRFIAFSSHFYGLFSVFKLSTAVSLGVDCIMDIVQRKVSGRLSALTEPEAD